jgi:hypothetical protein
VGVNIGVMCESRRVRFAEAGTWQKRSLRYLLGLAFVIAFWAGLRIGFAYAPGGHVVEVLFRSVRYALTGIALTWWAPAAFVRLGLAGREEG